jgi:hypothetical protein
VGWYRYRGKIYKQSTSMYWYKSVRITLCELAKKIILRKWKKNVRVRNENYGWRHYLGCGLDPGLAFETPQIGTIKNPECRLRSGSTNWIRKNTYFCTKHIELFILFWKTGNSGDKEKIRKKSSTKILDLRIPTWVLVYLWSRSEASRGRDPDTAQIREGGHGCQYRRKQN